MGYRGGPLCPGLCRRTPINRDSSFWGLRGKITSKDTRGSCGEREGKRNFIDVLLPDRLSSTRKRRSKRVGRSSDSRHRNVSLLDSFANQWLARERRFKTTDYSGEDRSGLGAMPDTGFPVTRPIQDAIEQAPTLCCTPRHCSRMKMIVNYSVQFLQKSRSGLAQPVPPGSHFGQFQVE